MSDDPVPAPQAGASTSPSFIAVHWRGELPLPTAFFGVYLFGTALAVAFVVMAMILAGPARGEMFSLPALMLGLLLLPALVWQVVGTWRSASRYRKDMRARGQSAAWGYAAQAVVVLGVIVVVLV